jgi:hypothetical protein
MLLDWIVAHAVGFWFKAEIYQKLPLSYRGQSAKVVAVQLNEVHRTPQTTNALGERLSDDDALNPYFDLVVRFDDGTLAMTTTYPVSLATGQEVELASNQNRLGTEMSTELPKIVGRDVYAVGYSRLYEPDTTLDELVGEPGTSGILKRLSLSEVPFLEPLPLMAAKYIDSVNGVVLKLRMPDGREALSFTNNIQLQGLLPGAPPRTFFEKVAGSLLVEIPSGISEKEIDAVRHKAMFPGMSRNILVDILGFPDKENDWGAGGKQLIYGRSLFVYLDSHDAVIDSQSLDLK